MIEKFITVRTQFSGQHRWKEAVDEVSFLREWHRHLFKVDVKIEVIHGNREVEYFMVLRRLDEYIDVNFRDKKFELSCEDIGEEIINNFLIPTYGDNRRYMVEIYEDGENSGSVVFTPDFNNNG